MNSIDCRKCGACCIAPSISSLIPGMGGGKPAGTRCVHLSADHTCGIYRDRPAVCREFTPTVEWCGGSFDDAMANLDSLEKQTR